MPGKQNQTDTLSIVTLNVYPGSPVPFVNGLAGSCRLPRMILQLRELDPDVICLQELFCSSSRKEICSGLAEYKMYAPPHAKTPTSQTIKACALVLWTTPVALSVYMIVSGSTAWRLFVAVACSLLAIWLCWQSAIIQWIVCDDSGLVMLWRRERLHAKSTQQHKFEHQLGDAMNVISPRAYQSIEFSSTCVPGFVCTVTNTHLNALGNDQNRCAQIQELLHGVSGSVAVAHAMVVCGDMNARPEEQSVSMMLAAGFKDCGALAGNTWDESTNDLCAGTMRVPAGRFDYIFAAYHTESLANREEPLLVEPTGTSHTHLYNICMEECQVVLDVQPVSDHFGIHTVFRIT